MNCQKVRENLWGYHHRQISDELNASVRSHLETCLDCANELEQFRRVEGALEGLAALEASPYFDQKLNARLDEVERSSSGWGWAAVWLRDRYLWTFATLFVVAVGLWLGFRHQQNEQLRSMEDVVRIQDENLQPRMDSVPEAAVSPQPNGQVAAIPERSLASSEDEDIVPDEDLAVVENFELLQDYDFLKALTDTSNGGDVRRN